MSHFISCLKGQYTFLIEFHHCVSIYFLFKGSVHVSNRFPSLCVPFISCLKGLYSFLIEFHHCVSLYFLFKGTVHVSYRVPSLCLPLFPV